jgi:hypothetical protein
MLACFFSAEIETKLNLIAGRHGEVEVVWALLIL